MMRRRLWFCLLALLDASLLCSAAGRPFHVHGQETSRTQKAKSEGTFRVGVGLVQTDVAVFDRKGRFVDDLKPDQFEFLVDGKPCPVDFFELVTEGGPISARMAATTVSPGKATPSSTSAGRSTTVYPDSGRTLLFFLDDLHLSAESMMRARAALQRLIEEDMGVNDRAAIFTASRQLGFLQQLSDNKSMLRLAASRLNFSQDAPRDSSRPAMSEAQAEAIEQGDSDVIGYFVDQTVSAYGIPNDAQGRSMALEITKGRASALAHVSSEFAVRSLASLGNVVQSCAALPGRKLLFFLSDGFVMQQQKENIAYRLRLVAEAATWAAIVIYTLDTRGLVVGLPSAASPPAYATPGAEPAGRLERGPNEVFAVQDGLNALAADTGGRFLKNTNALGAAIVSGIEESARYYLLGWHVDPALLRPGKYSSIRVKIRDHPEFDVRLRQGAMDLSKLIPKAQSDVGKSAASKSNSEGELVQAVQFPWPINELPVYLYVGYYYDPGKGYMLDISFQTYVQDSGAGASTGKQDRLDVMGIVANRDGANVDRFKDSLGPSVDPLTREPAKAGMYAGVRMTGIDPGVYQVRVAVRDPKSGRLGSAHQWIDVPRVDLLPSASRRILLSSVFLKRKQSAASGGAGVSNGPFDEQQFSAERLFTPSRLFYSVQVYNEAGSSILMQTKVYRGNRVISQSPSVPIDLGVPAKGGLTFVDGEVSLEGLAPGPYVLEVITTESSTGPVARQLVPFSIEAR
jgi:VWFA-related protein